MSIDRTINITVQKDNKELKVTYRTGSQSVHLDVCENHSERQSISIDHNAVRELHQGLGAILEAIQADEAARTDRG